MRHRGPKQTHLTTSSASSTQQPTVLPGKLPNALPSKIGARRRLLAITAALASLAGSGVAVAIGTSMAASTPPLGVNLLANPGFENGLTGWTGSTSTVPTRSRHHSGAVAADLSAPLLAANVAVSGKKTRQTTVTLTTTAAAPTVAGGVYHAVVWASAPAGPANAVMRLTELRGSTIVRQHASRLQLRNTTWHQLKLNFTAAAAGDTLRFTVVANGLLPGRSLLADDAALTLTSDPGPTATDTATPTTTPTDPPTATPTDTPTPTPTVTPTPTPTPPPVTGGALIGTTFGTSLSATEAQFPTMQVAHFYYPGAPQAWGGSIATIPARQPIIVSFNYDVATTAAGGSDAAFTQVLRSWAASGRTIYWNWQHEADNPSKNISPAAYRAGWDRLLADAAAVNAPNLHSMSIVMAIELTGVHGAVDSWYIPGVDVVGFDSYYLDTELLAEQYAHAKGKPLAFPEFGAAIGGSSDAVSAAFTRAFIAALDSNTIAAVWFNNNGNDLATHPATLAVLKGAVG